MRNLLLALLLLTLAPLVCAAEQVGPRTLSPASANNADLISLECAIIKQIDVQLTGTWTATVAFQASNDGTNWGSIVAFPIGTVAGTPVTSTTANGQWAIPVVARYVRIRTTAYTSGTVAGTIVAREAQTATPTQQVSISGTPTVNLGTGGTSATSIGKARDSAIGATDTGVAMLGVRRDAPTTETPAAGDYVVPQYSALGEAWIKDIGAGTTHHAISAASTNATSVKTSAGTVNQIIVSNVNAAVRYFKLYNLASAPTVGTSTPVLTLAIPAGQTVVVPMGPRGLRLGTGIAYALTTGITVADTGAVSASEHAVHISYE